MRDGCRQTKPGKRERKGSVGKDRKVDMKNKGGMRGMDTPDWNSTCEKTLPAAAPHCLKMKDEAGGGKRARDPSFCPHAELAEKEENGKLLLEKPGSQKLLCSRAETEKKAERKLLWDITACYLLRLQVFWGLKSLCLRGFFSITADSEEFGKYRRCHTG